MDFPEHTLQRFRFFCLSSSLNVFAEKSWLLETLDDHPLILGKQVVQITDSRGVLSVTGFKATGSCILPALKEDICFWVSVILRWEYCVDEMVDEEELVDNGNDAPALVSLIRDVVPAYA